MEITNITSYKMLESITQKFTTIVEDLWNNFSKLANIIKQSKTWWNEKYNRDLVIYWIPRQRSNWVKYRKMVKLAKRVFFNSKI